MQIYSAAGLYNFCFWSFCIIHVFNHQLQQQGTLLLILTVPTSEQKPNLRFPFQPYRVLLILEEMCEFVANEIGFLSISFDRKSYLLIICSFFSGLYRNIAYFNNQSLKMS